MTSLFDPPNNNDAAAPKTNIPEFSVGELAFSLKRTLEDNYGRVRVRGELSRVSIAGSGHMYSSLKDDQAVIDAVCWKGNLNKLSIQPEEGLDVICIGRLSSYPKSSKYQLIIESMELAGEGALLKMLEERRKKLAAEGLFEDNRKKQLPFLPETIGVVTSPTGAVIRDILHRLADRFPRHVLVWPVLVQGDGAAKQISTAIQGFNAIQPDNSAAKRPDLLIVARGGGSLEDLMAFNEENVVRAVAESNIPIISAIGHETDTTLCDYAADLRAPTPTGAAEMAVPHRRDLMAQVLDDEKRLLHGLNRLLSEMRHRLEAQTAKLGNPAQLLEVKQQNIDHQAQRLEQSFTQNLKNKHHRVSTLSAQLQHPRHIVQNAQQRLKNTEERLIQSSKQVLKDPQSRLESSSRLLESLSFKRVLERGYSVIRAESGTIIDDPNSVTPGQNLSIEFKDDKKLSVIATDKNNTGKKKPKSSPEVQEQTNLF